MSDPDVDDPSPAVAAMADAWALIDALTAGTEAMRQAGKKYLPQFPGEADDAYKDRVKSATLFPAFSRTSQVLAAKPFARPMAVEGSIPSVVKDLFDDVDMEGTHLQPFVASLFLRTLRQGLTGVLVDVPRSEGLRTLADEKAAGVRPYWTVYPGPTILGWRSQKTPEGDALTLLRLLETVEEDDGEWFTKPVRQVRVLRPGSWETWRKIKTTDRGEIWAIHDEGKTSLSKVPFVFYYGLRQGFGLGKPPLLELAHLNVEHYQSSSDQRNILHVARVPILFAKGFSEDDRIVIGAGQACKSNNSDADLRFVEHTGAAIEAGRQSIQDLEDQMRQIGAELLIQRPAMATATQVTTDSEGNRSTLQSIAESFERSIEGCIRLMAEWLSQTAEPEVTLHKDFGAEGFAENGGDLLLRAAGDDHVSSETVFNALKRADVVPNDLTWDEEKLRLASQPRGAPLHRNKTPKPTPPTDAA